MSGDEAVCVVSMVEDVYGVEYFPFFVRSWDGIRSALEGGFVNVGVYIYGVVCGFR